VSRHWTEPLVVAALLVFAWCAGYRLGTQTAPTPVAVPTATPCPYCDCSEEMREIGGWVIERCKVIVDEVRAECPARQRENR
jgi:hypothetical protein